MYKHLETERLIIRPINSSDANFIKKLVNSDGWLKFIGDRNIHTISDSEQYIQKILGNSKYFYSVTELKDTCEPIGIVTFLYRDQYDYPDIGFALLPEFMKKGYSFEASKKYLDEILNRKTLSKVFGITIPENTNSIKLLEKLGFTFANKVVKENEELFLYELIIR